MLLTEDSTLKVCDFGTCAEASTDPDYSVYVADNMRTTYCGTFEYMAPEMIEQLPHDHQVDTWALGILLFELMHGYAPFRDERVFVILRQIKSLATSKEAIKFETGISQSFKDLIYAMLVPKPSERLPLEEVFHHPWVLHFQQKHGISFQPDSYEPAQNSPLSSE